MAKGDLLDPFKPVEALLAAAGVIEPDPSARTKIKITPVISKLAEAVGLALGAPPKLFLRGDAVMKIEYDPAQGDIDFFPMKETEFVTWIERFVTFGVEQEIKDEETGEGTGKKRWIEKSIQTKTARLILDSPQFREKLPRVLRKNRVRLPVIRERKEGEETGRIELLPTGFDEASGVFTFPSKVIIDEAWTVTRSIEHLQGLYSEFVLPLVTVGEGENQVLRQCPRAIGACIASLVATFAEGLLPSHTLRCGFISTANSSGSGKSLICKIPIAAITGQAAGLTLGKDEESLRSRIDAMLLSGQSSIFFDNVKGYIESSIIEALMTLPYWQGRTYHTQRMFTVKIETTVFISGNNATVSPDINRRFIYIELFNEQADLNLRKVTREIDDRWLVDAKNRGDILSALWALVRHWDGLGRPGAPTWIAGFKEWCNVVGGIVCSVTDLSKGAIGNPLVQPELASSGDKEMKHMRRLVELLIDDGRLEQGKAQAKNLEFEPHELAELAMTHGLFEWFLPDLPEGRDVADVLKQPERVRFGKLVSARSGESPRGVKYLVKEGERSVLWRLSYRGSGRHRRYLLDQD